MQIIRRQPATNKPLNDEIPPILEKVFRNRGIVQASQLSVQAKHLYHYNQLCNIDKAASIIANAVVSNKRIAIVGDFDADGATSTVLCILALKAMGYQNVSYIVPNRFDYGYGLTPPVVDIAHQDNVELLITVDNGISSHKGVDYAKSMGMQVIVTDHHLSPEILPNADAIVNPNQSDCEFESKNLAGVGVAFYVMSATRNTLLEREYFSQNNIPLPNMANFLDIVAIGTVADVVKLDKNNRILVHQGIQRIRSGRTRPGVLALLQLSNRQYTRCCASDIGFTIGPRLNAAGRLEDMSTGIECLLSEDKHKATQLAAELDGLNQARREIEQSMHDDAELAIANLKLTGSDVPNAIVLYQADFHQGVVGIVAGRIKEKYYRPCFVFAIENEQQTQLKGSGRSVEGVHIRDVLARIDSLAPNLLIKFGGHAMAAGVSIEKTNLPKFTKLLNMVVGELTESLPNSAQIYSDGSLSPTNLTIQTAHTLKYSLPWGQGFDEPIFDGIFTLVNQRIVGQKHLKMTVLIEQLHIDAIAFNVDVNKWPNEEVKQVKLAYKLDINEFRGQTNLQLLVMSLEAVL